MNRHLFLATTLSTTLLFSQALAFTPTCTFFGLLCNEISQPQANQQINNYQLEATNNQSFWDRVLNNWKEQVAEWKAPSFFGGSQNTENPVQVAQLGNFSPSTIDTGNKIIDPNTPKSSDFGILNTLNSKDESKNSLLNVQAISERKAIFDCALKPSPDCVKYSISSNQQSASSSIQIYDKNDESVDPDHSNSGPQIIYSDKQSAETPYLIPGTNQYASQPFTQYAQGSSGPSIYTGGAPIDMSKICASAAGKSGQLLNPNGADLSNVNKKLLGDAQAASAAVGKPLTVVSGYRSQAKQDSICASGGTGAKACGAGGSRHTQGLALDIQFRGYTDAEKVKAILVFLAGGWSIGNYANDGHTHVGLDGGEMVWRWFGVYPQLYKQEAFKRASINFAAEKTSPRSQVIAGAKKALEVLCK